MGCLENELSTSVRYTGRDVFGCSVVRMGLQLI